jgi:hypothetical protein
MTRSSGRTHTFITFIFVSLLASTIMAGQPTPPTPADDDKQPAAAQPTAAKFPEAQKLLKSAVADWVANFPKKPLPTVLKTYVLAPDWGMVRTATGVITARTVQTVIFVRGGETGRCTKRLCNLRQEELGGKWGRAGLDCVEQYTQRVSCRSVEALAPQ